MILAWLAWQKNKNVLLQRVDKIIAIENANARKYEYDK